MAIMSGTRLFSLSAVVCLLAACAGGGGGGGTSAGTGALASGGSGNGAVVVNNILIRPPADSPRVGDNKTPSPTATASGPSFAGGSQAVSGTAFPLVQDAVALRPATLEIGEASSVTNGGATLTVRNNGYELAIPSLGIDTVLAGDGSSVPVSAQNTVVADVKGTLSLGIFLHQYVGGGLWIYKATDTQASTSAVFSPFIFGYSTPKSAIPLVGTANYTAPGGLDSFAAGSVTGSATNILAYDSNNNTSGWNDVSINANIRAVPDFQGKTAAASAPGTAFALKTNAVGNILGYFFGPNLDSIGAVWSLGNTDDSGAAYGLVGSDRTGGTLPVLSAQYLSFLLPHFNWSNGGTPNIPDPLAATRDNVTTPSVFATMGGPAFDGSGAPLFPNNGSPLSDWWFPVWISGLQLSATTITPIANFTGAVFKIGAPDGHLTLSIPSLGINDPITFTGAHLPATPASSANGGTGEGFVNYGLSYTEFGAWSSVVGATGSQTSTGLFSYGFETPAGAMPATGTATYALTGGVGGTAFARSGSNLVEATVSGDASLTANFGTGAVSGNFTNMSAYSSGAFTPWNNVSVSANIAGSSNRFSGSTASASAPVGAFALKSTATGHIDGGFYGPNANELGAIWTLSNGDGTGSAIGVVGAIKH
jgi:hypothetical protein